MTGYTILKTDKLPETLKNKPRWVICVVFTSGLLIMTLSAIAAGVFIGYTYCYVEHRTGFRTGNITQSKELQFYNAPQTDSDEYDKKTINGAIMSSKLIQRILKIGHTLLDQDHMYLPGSLDDMKLSGEI